MHARDISKMGRKMALHERDLVEFCHTQQTSQVVMLTFHVAHMYFRTTHKSLLGPIHCNNVKVKDISVVCQIEH